MQRWGDFERAVKDGASAGRLAGTISGRQDRRTRKGTPMMILTLSDQSGSFEIIAFSEQINEFGAVLQPGKSTTSAFSTRQASIAGGTVSVDVTAAGDRAEASASYAAATCG